MVCTKCGREVAADARFCSNCGEAVAPRGINVQQTVGTVSGTVTGLMAGQDGLPDVAVRTDQKVDTVDAGGTVTGVVLGGAGQTNVGGQHYYGEVVQGDQVRGDTISVGDISGSSGIAIGRGARSSVQTVQTSADHADTRAELQLLLAQLRALLSQVPAAQTSEAEAVGTLASQAVDLAISPQPNKMMVQITANGLKQAAQNLATVLPVALKIAELVGKIVP